MSCKVGVVWFEGLWVVWSWGGVWSEGGGLVWGRWSGLGQVVWSGAGGLVWKGWVVWSGGGESDPHPEMATAAVGTHPAGMHPCLLKISIQLNIQERDSSLEDQLWL